MIFKKPSKTTIYFTTDIHGSETCFMKFVNAAMFYKADIVILGGDITGKMLIPLVEMGGGAFTCNFLGKDLTVANEEQLQAVSKQIRQTGYYPYKAAPDEIKEMKAKPELVEKIFGQVMYEEMIRWVEIAEDRLRNSNTRIYITPGNDDQFDIDKALEQSERIINPEGNVEMIDDHHEMISTGYGNITPWNCPRDIEEDELAAKIEVMAEQVNNMENCIFNFHCPPYDLLIDNAPELDETLKPIMDGSGPKMIPVGSKAVRAAIEKYQPLLGLHGHIHESRGISDLGRTKCINPGSEYADGYLRGALVTLNKGKMLSIQLTSG